MMNINRKNYESYLVDYSEGKLSASQARQVESFLAENPDIKEVFEIFIGGEIESDDTSFSNKDLLKSIPYDKTTAQSDFFQEQCIAKIENLLSADEQKQFKISLSNDPEKLKEYNLFSKTVLNAEHLIYNEKLTLKQNYTSHVINPNNFNEYSVACSEGWLNHEGMLALNEFIAANPTYKKEYDLFQQIKLSPNYNVVFLKKSSLKKFRVLNFATAKIYSVAASVAAVFALGYFVVKTPEILNNVQTASTIQVQSLKQQAKPMIKQDFDKQSFVVTNTKKLSKVTQTNIVLNTQELSKFNSRNETLPLEVIKPKTINYIECKKCTVNKPDLAVFEARRTRTDNPTNQIADLNEQNVITPKTLANNLLKSGVAKLDKVTKGKVNISKDENNKTKFEISTKYLAFSTNIKSNKRN